MSTFLFCTDGLNATVKFISKPETKNGKVYWNVVKCELNIKSLENFKVNFDNLFNGDKTLGKYKSMQPNIIRYVTRFGREKGKTFVFCEYVG